MTTASDEKGRATVYDLLGAMAALRPQVRIGVTPMSIGDKSWVGPVGRLDKASEGLLLFTNDSEWAAKITDPESHLEKRYHVQVDCIAGDELLARIERGVRVGGEHLQAGSVRVVRSGRKNSWLEITLKEGKNRQIRRLLEALGVQVLRLVRISIGPLELGDLSKSAVRVLTDAEKQTIDQALHRGT